MADLNQAQEAKMAKQLRVNELIGQADPQWWLKALEEGGDDLSARQLYLIAKQCWRGAGKTAGLSPALLVELIKRIADHPAVQEGSLVILARLPLAQARLSVAQSKQATPGSLAEVWRQYKLYLADEEAAGQEDEPANQLPLALAHNPNTPDEVWRELLELDVPEIWTLAATACLIREPTLRKLEDRLQDAITGTREITRAAQSLRKRKDYQSCPGVEEILQIERWLRDAHDYNAEVADLMNLAQHCARIRRSRPLAKLLAIAICMHDKVTAEVLRQLAQSSLDIVWLLVAEMELTDTETLVRLAQRGVEIKHNDILLEALMIEVINHPNATDEVLLPLLGASDPQMISYVVSAPLAGPKALRAAWQCLKALEREIDEYDHSIRWSVGWPACVYLTPAVIGLLTHPNCSQEIRDYYQSLGGGATYRVLMDGSYRPESRVGSWLRPVAPTYDRSAIDMPGVRYFQQIATEMGFGLWIKAISYELADAASLDFVAQKFVDVMNRGSDAWWIQANRWRDTETETFVEALVTNPRVSKATILRLGRIMGGRGAAVRSVIAKVGELPPQMELFPEKAKEFYDSMA